jgi:hypothetical protein
MDLLTFMAEVKRKATQTRADELTSRKNGQKAVVSEGIRREALAPSTAELAGTNYDRLGGQQEPYNWALYGEARAFAERGIHVSEDGDVPKDDRKRAQRSAQREFFGQVR